MRGTDFGRREAILSLIAVGGAALAACRGSSADITAATDNQAGSPPATQAAAMTVYRDPACGCCEKWAERAREAGYRVAVIDSPDMAAIKRRHGVPDSLRSCHTTLVGGYSVEGHVPLEAVTRLLNERPAGISGIAVAGMPRGSPGMEVPDGSKDPFQVMAFDSRGKVSVFSA